MSDSGEQTPLALDRTLGRIEELTSALYHGPETAGREAARELLEVVLDLHGLALARVCATVAAIENGAELTRLIVGDPYARAVMLLHGLHPLSVEERLREAITRMETHWGHRGVEVRLLRVADGTARVRVYKNDNGEPDELLTREVEGVLANAAPDLDGIAIEFDHGPDELATRLASEARQELGRRIEA